MSRYFPHAAYAEDQPLARTILTVHVLTRGYTTGAVVGLGVSAVGGLYNRLRGAKASAPTPLTTTLRSARLLRSTGTASAVGLGLMGIALVGRMQGRDDIEWRDRAWRLMVNQGQLETDDWTYGGAVAGLVAVAVRPQLKTVGGWRVFAGATGLGSVAGTAGYLIWRYGLHGGKHVEYAAVEKPALSGL
ncbi:uncharacterized protein ColSpa_01087 [Colletotrichum spaethianum]|uniref:Uncharacterized protein n=1 Tax=Colletotrichum spaethianum TaxID=700344 RepID=A0AA37L384_9PEZI|nr:uncharacterized protein ColSpa_01087 [Colletotrichum spaethianum]GKT40906.1 hypothetical protein ColSpa_01087 [Colletotrichum spaethianum]